DPACRPGNDFPMRCLFVTLSALVLAVAGFAQTGASTAATAPTPARAQLEVTAVRFGFATPPESTARWLEIAIDVRVQPESGNFVDRPRVMLALATKSGGGSGGERVAKLNFYRANATAVALERGAARFRFYLPPEIVRRD